MNKKEVTLRLSYNDAGQVIDGLRVCLENWQKTLRWYDGKLEDPDFVILECSGREEAAQMVDVYADLLETLEQQMKIYFRLFVNSCEKSGMTVEKLHDISRRTLRAIIGFERCLEGIGSDAGVGG